MIRGAYYEDAPLFSSEIRPPYGPGMSQTHGPMFQLIYTYLGDQWSVGDWNGLQQAIPRDLPPALLQGLATMAAGNHGTDSHAGPNRSYFSAGEPPQTFKEYDPEWARAFWTGSATASCDQARMLAAVKVPVLFTHHFRTIDEESGRLQGALTDLQVRHARDLITQAGQRFDYKSLPDMAHNMNQTDAHTYTAIVRDWTATFEN